MSEEWGKPGLAEIPRQLQKARQSPRVSNGDILFYEGDTFCLILELEISEDGQGQHQITGKETVEVEIFDASGTRIYQKTYDASQIENNCIELPFDEALVAKLPAGRYSMAATLNWQYRTTILAKSDIVVQRRMEI